MERLTFEQYVHARKIHLQKLKELRKFRREDGSYPGSVGIKVSKAQTYLDRNRKNYYLGKDWR